MAKIIITPQEPELLIELLESAFPDVKLDALKSFCGKTDFSGSIIKAKRPLKTSTIELIIECDAPTPVK
jgi:hypothetical protein